MRKEDIFRIIGVLAGLSAGACGCTLGPDFVRPEAPKVTRYTRADEPALTRVAGGRAQRFDAGAKVPENWWRLFNPTKLDPLLQSALAKNQTIQGAIATLRESQQNVLAGEGVFYPQLNAGFDVTRERSNPASFGVNAGPSIFNLFTLSSSVSYALDLFGGERRSIEGLQAQEDAQRSAVQAAYLTLTGSLINSVIARAAYAAEAVATQEIVRAQSEEIALTRSNVSAGTVPYASLLSLQSQLAATQANLPPLAQRINQSDHLLAALSGEFPSEWVPPPITFMDLQLPADLPKSLPSQLVRERPDILQAEAQLHAAGAQIGVATAALFPSFTLNGSLGLQNVSGDSLLNSGRSSLWSIGAGITSPIFHGGTLRAQKQAAVEAYQASLANYRQTVLGAFQQVSDTLRALEHDAELVQAQEDGLRSADQALKLIQANYRAGTAGYLQLLNAQAFYFQAKIGSIQAAAQRLQDSVALFVALGGSWAPNSSQAGVEKKSR